MTFSAMLVIIVLNYVAKRFNLYALLMNITIDWHKSTFASVPITAVLMTSDNKVYD